MLVESVHKKKIISPIISGIFNCMLQTSKDLVLDRMIQVRHISHDKSVFFFNKTFLVLN